MRAYLAPIRAPFERSEILAKANFRLDNSAATPTTVEWKLENLSAFEVKQDWLSVSAASSVTIDIPASIVTVKNRTADREQYALTVSANRALSTATPDTKLFWVTRVGAYD